MNDSMAPPSAEDLTLLQQVVRSVARAHRLRRADAEDFSQSVQLRLLQTNYEMFRRFSARSSLRTYLSVVVTRLLLDWRNSTYGKWRASAAAVRLGPSAIALERLVCRDGYTVDEAIECLGVRSRDVNEDALRRLAGRIALRGRPRMVSDDVLRRVPALTFEDPIDAASRRRAIREVRAALALALRQLPAQERHLLYLRYRRRYSVKRLALAFHSDPKHLYRHFDRTLRTLRKAMVARGVTGATALSA